MEFLRVKTERAISRTVAQPNRFLTRARISKEAYDLELMFGGEGDRLFRVALRVNHDSRACLLVSDGMGGMRKVGKTV
jgi:hypothetical protein